MNDMIITDHAPCPTCLKNKLIYFLEIMNEANPGFSKIVLDTRFEAIKNNREEKVELELPMIFGCKGKAVYSFDGRDFK